MKVISTLVPSAWRCKHVMTLLNAISAPLMFLVSVAQRMPHINDLIILRFYIERTVIYPRNMFTATSARNNVS